MDKITIGTPMCEYDIVLSERDVQVAIAEYIQARSMVPLGVKSMNVQISAHWGTDADPTAKCLEAKVKFLRATDRSESNQP